MESPQICPFEHSSIEIKVLRRMRRKTWVGLALCHVLTGFVCTTLSSSAIPHAGPKVLHLATGETTLQLHQCYSQGYKLAFGILNKAVFIAFFGVRHEAYEIRT